MRKSPGSLPQRSRCRRAADARPRRTRDRAVTRDGQPRPGAALGARFAVDHTTHSARPTRQRFFRTNLWFGRRRTLPRHAPVIAHRNGRSSAPVVARATGLGQRVMNLLSGAELLAPARYLRQEMPADGIWVDNSHVSQVANSSVVDPSSANSQLAGLDRDGLHGPSPHPRRRCLPIRSWSFPLRRREPAKCVRSA